MSQDSRLVAPADLTDRRLLREPVDPEQDPISSGAVPSEPRQRLDDIRADSQGGLHFAGP